LRPRHEEQSLDNERHYTPITLTSSLPSAASHNTSMPNVRQLDKERKALMEECRLEKSKWQETVEEILSEQETLEEKIKDLTSRIQELQVSQCSCDKSTMEVDGPELFEVDPDPEHNDRNITMEAQHKSAIKTLKNEHRIAVAALEADVKRLESEHGKALEDLQKSKTDNADAHKNELNNLKSSHENAIEALRNTHHMALSEAK